MTEKHFSISEIENAFFNHAADAGVKFTNPIKADGQLHREHVEGDKLGTKNGAYILHGDSPASGWFLHYKTGISGKWTLSDKREPITKPMLEEIEQERQRRKIEQQTHHDRAANKAVFIWDNATPITEQSQHYYLIKKHVQPQGERLYSDALVIPIYDENKQLVNLQFIHADGTKRFLSGGQKKDCFYQIGNLKEGDIILICEGFATAASLNDHTGYSTVVAFDAGNLKSVAVVMRRLFPSSQIIIAGDNDESGTGQKAAREAALAINCKYIIPETAGHDWNDSLTMEASHG